MILKDFRTTKKVTIKSMPGSEVEIFSGILFKDSMTVDGLKKNPEDAEKLLKTIAVCIKSWNFTNEAGEPLPINEESLNLLSPDSIGELSNEITNFILEKKSI